MDKFFCLRIKNNNTTIMYDPYFPILSSASPLVLLYGYCYDIIFIVQIPLEFTCFKSIWLKPFKLCQIPKPVFAVFQNLVNVEADTVVESCSSNVKLVNWKPSYLANPPMVQNQINPSLSWYTKHMILRGSPIILKYSNRVLKDWPLSVVSKKHPKMI